MVARHPSTALLLSVFAAACAANPLEILEDPTAELTVDLAISSSHISTLSSVTFTVTVTDGHGMAVTDFDTLRVEQRAEGSETWRGTDLTMQGNIYVGTYTFMSSGHYEMRVSGRRHHDMAMVSMHTMSEELEVERAHTEAGGYRVEFESFPGHLHESDVGTAKFWVMETTADASGNRAAITGLGPDIDCTESDGSEEEHVATESTAGVYEAQHTWVHAGASFAALHFTGSDGSPAEASFTFNVSHGH